MPAYRSEDFIAEAIQSVLDQTFTDFELIVIDDASPDKTFEIVRSFSDPRLRASRNDTNVGPEANWNKTLLAARGQFIKVLPGDDTLYRTCLERQVGVLRDAAHGRVVLVCCGRDIVDRHGRKVMTARFGGDGQVSGSQLVRRTVRRGTNVIGEPGAVLFRVDASRAVGGFDASLGYVIDLDYWVRLLGRGDAYVLRDALCTFRISGANWSVDLGSERCRHFAALVDRIAAQPSSRLSVLDRLMGHAMARVNERLRRVFYRRVVGLERPNMTP